MQVFFFSRFDGSPELSVDRADEIDEGPLVGLGGVDHHARVVVGRAVTSRDCLRAFEPEEVVVHHGDEVKGHGVEQVDGHGVKQVDGRGVEQVLRWPRRRRSSRPR